MFWKNMTYMFNNLTFSLTSSHLNERSFQFSHTETANKYRGQILGLICNAKKCAEMFPCALFSVSNTDALLLFPRDKLKKQCDCGGNVAL